MVIILIVLMLSLFMFVLNCLIHLRSKYKEYHNLNTFIIPNDAYY